MYEDGGQATGFDVDLRVKVSEPELLRADFDPCQNVLLGPYLFADGVLAPKPLPNPDGWEPMGDLQYRALYYALCRFNQLNRTGVEWKAWGPQADEVVYSYPDTSAFYFLTMFVFLDVFTKVCAPTARRVQRFKEESPAEWELLMKTMEGIAGDNEHPQHNRISAKQFMEMMRHWRKHVGIPQDLHGALADFLPGMCNIFRIRKCAVMHEYDRKLAELGAEPVGVGLPDLPPDAGPRGELLAQAVLFAGDGSHRLGMIKDVAELPRVRQKLTRAQQILGFDVLDLCLNGPAEKLESLEFNGVAMYMAGWAAYEKYLHDDPEKARRVGAVAGLEVGEYVALSVAGVVPFEVGLELAHVRGRAMLEASAHIPDQTVCSVAGLPEDRVDQLCQLAKAATGLENDVCQVATSLFSKGYVVGGRTKVITKFHELATEAKALQAKVMPQKANHTPLMHPVQWAIKAKLREHRHKFRVPWCDVYFNGNASFYLPANGGNVKEPIVEVEFALNRLLCETCWSPLRWDRIMQTMVDNKITHFVECGPTKQLKALLRRINKEANENMINIVV
uniref:Malonyl-CoA:ACP transacylase (MAT) domain-containing protein n=1 Tax=Alexandrium monilatum TaxID=311494 RepID=A0A7S4T2R5_9DINO